MDGATLSPQDYESELKDLRQRLKLYLDSGVGDMKQLLKDAQRVLEMGAEYPEVLGRYRDVEGLVADLLARGQQQKFLSGQSSGEAPGCLLGWLFRKQGRT
jgi:hypothetical protein